jgi:hypothetical protein
MGDETDDGEDEPMRRDSTEASSDEAEGTVAALRRELAIQKDVLRDVSGELRQAAAETKSLKERLAAAEDRSQTALVRKIPANIGCVNCPALNLIPLIAEAEYASRRNHMFSIACVGIIHWRRAHAKKMLVGVTPTDPKTYLGSDFERAAGQVFGPGPVYDGEKYLQQCAARLESDEAFREYVSSSRFHYNWNPYEKSSQIFDFDYLIEQFLISHPEFRNAVMLDRAFVEAFVEHNMQRRAGNDWMQLSSKIREDALIRDVRGPPLPEGFATAVPARPRKTGSKYCGRQILVANDMVDRHGTVTGVENCRGTVIAWLPVAECKFVDETGAREACYLVRFYDGTLEGKEEWQGEHDIVAWLADYDRADLGLPVYEGDYSLAMAGESEGFVDFVCKPVE